MSRDTERANETKAEADKIQNRTVVYETITLQAGVRPRLFQSHGCTVVSTGRDDEVWTIEADGPRTANRIALQGEYAFTDIHHVRPKQMQYACRLLVEYRREAETEYYVAAFGNAGDKPEIRLYCGGYCIEILQLPRFANNDTITWDPDTYAFSCTREDLFIAVQGVNSTEKTVQMSHIVWGGNFT